MGISVERRPEESKQKPTQSVGRALSLLDVLGDAERGLTLTEIAQRSQVHMTTCLRLLRTLGAFGLVARDYGNGHYRLGPKIFTLAHALERQLDIRDLARPILQQLTEFTGEMSSIAIQQGDEVMLLERRVSRNELGFLAGPGARAPLYCTSAGKVVLAHADIELLELVLSGPLQQRTPTTITNSDALRVELAKIRCQGYAIDNCEREHGLFGVAAPVRDVSNRVVATIGISGPAERFNTPALDSWIAALRDAANDLSTQLGWSVPMNISF